MYIYIYIYIYIYKTDPQSSIAAETLCNISDMFMKTVTINQHKGNYRSCGEHNLLS